MSERKTHAEIWLARFRMGMEIDPNELYNGTEKHNFGDGSFIEWNGQTWEVGNDARKKD